MQISQKEKLFKSYKKLSAIRGYLTLHGPFSALPKKTSVWPTLSDLF